MRSLRIHIIQYNGRIFIFLKNHLKPKLYGSSYKKTVGFSYLYIFFHGIIFFMIIIIFLNHNDSLVIYWDGVIFSSAGVVRKRKKTVLAIS